MPSHQLSQMALMAPMNSRICFAAPCHGIENRRVMCGLICEPRPRRNRPFDITLISWAATAMFIGFRAKATAMPVPSSSVSVRSAASTSGKNGSRLVSAVNARSKPSASSFSDCSPM